MVMYVLCPCTYNLTGCAACLPSYSEICRSDMISKINMGNILK